MRKSRAGFTLVELIVVLLLLSIAAAVVGPSLWFAPRPPPDSELLALVGGARDAAIRRGETVRLRIDRSGAWLALAGASASETVARDTLMSGRLAAPRAASTDLFLSPLGTCAPAVESESAFLPAGLDPLTCDRRPR